jgi:hypothetical protein
LHIKNLAIIAKDFIIIDLQEKAIIKDITREDTNKDINIEEVITYLKKKNLYFSIDKYKLRENSSDKQERLKNILHLYKSF